MLKNYLKVALRNLWKNKAFSAINIVGLSAGLAVCLLIVLYVKDELSYDKYNSQAENIYRVDADIFFNGTQFTSAVSPAISTAYYFMHNWLQNYQYRTNLSGWIFVVAGLGAMVITLLTVSFQAIKAAVANPVKSLRTE